MTTELEKQFFETFGIEPKHNDGCKLSDLYEKNKKQISLSYDAFIKKNCTEGDSGLCYSTCPFAYDDVEYPTITDTQYLELICFFSTEIDYFTCFSSDIETLKEDILTEFIFNNKLIDKQQVQSLFKGE